MRSVSISTSTPAKQFFCGLVSLYVVIIDFSLMYLKYVKGERERERAKEMEKVGKAWK